MSDRTTQEDPLQYELLIRESLRDVIRRALDIVARQGLYGDHHFSITFLTGHPGVILPDHLRPQYPEQMTIVLQHQFWDLTVGRESFSVAVTLGGQRQSLTVPFGAITTFLDPGAEFGLQLTADGGADEHDPAPEATEGDEHEAAALDEAPAGEVVQIDAFRQR